MESKRKLKCRMECRNGGMPCMDYHKKGYSCTRNEGHKGNHVACGCGFGDHEIKIWD